MIKALLLLLQAGKLGKLLLTGGTMVLSVIAYSWIFGQAYAVGFVVMFSNSRARRLGEIGRG